LAITDAKVECTSWNCRNDNILYVKDSGVVVIYRMYQVECCLGRRNRGGDKWNPA
jgi:hypothetical protein